MSPQTRSTFECSLTVFCDCGWATTARIVNGSAAGVAEFPSVCSLRYRPAARDFCGGTVVSSTYVLTAAHCLPVYQTSDVEVVVGQLYAGRKETYTQVFGVAQPIAHPDYKRGGDDVNDVALLRLDGVIAWSRAVAPVCLPFYYT